jgi:hypothetical protein
MTPSLLFYAIGWAPDALPRHPALPADFLSDPVWQRLQPFYWIHTGSQFVPLPDALLPLWHDARHQPQPWPVISQALSHLLDDEPMQQVLWQTLQDLHVFLPWPWFLAQDDNGLIEPACWHLIGTAAAPNPWPHDVPDALWRETPSLAQLATALHRHPYPWNTLALTLPDLLHSYALHWVIRRTIHWSSAAQSLLIPAGSPS